MIRNFRALTKRATSAKLRPQMRVLAVMAFAATLLSGLILQPKAQAYGSCVTSYDCHWRAAQDNIAAVTVGSTGVWALSSVASPYGQQVLKARWYSQGNGEYGYWIFDADGGARGTSITTSLDTGNPWVIAYDSSVWYRQDGGWYSLPAKRCEDGGVMKAQQVLGRNSIAAAESYLTYVVESSDTPNASLRYFSWANWCWIKLPAPPSTPVSVDVWMGKNPENRRLPWIATANSNIYLWDGGAWQQITTGLARGVGKGAVIGNDGNSLWFMQSNKSFVKDTAWKAGNVLQISDPDWAVSTSHRAYHWEN